MTRQEWINFLDIRIQQIEKYSASVGRIMLDLRQAKDLLMTLIGVPEDDGT